MNNEVEMASLFDKQGYVLVKGLGSTDTCREMAARVEALTRSHSLGQSIGDAYVVEEKALKDSPDPVLRLSKLFRLHREEPVFYDWIRLPEVTQIAQQIIGGNIDCFLSQFIFKHPGAMGQPWHQDRYYFNFDRSNQVGIWLAITEAHADNGPLWILPGSHREPVHAVVKDARENANDFYVEIVDHDMSNAECVLMEPGDVLFFHSHLMHKSTDNLSQDRRAAMVFHFGESGTIDHNLELYGRTAPNIDWVPVLRDGETIR